MGKKREVAVIGLGSFGGSLVESLVEKGIDVIAIDKNPDLVNKYMRCATRASIADATDIEVLKSLAIGNLDHVVVSIGQDINASILTTINLQELGVKNLTVKAFDEKHAIVLERIGIENIVYPERDSAQRIAYRIMIDTLVDFLGLAKDYSIVQLKVESNKITDVPLQELGLISKYDIVISAIKRNEKIVIATANEVIKQNDVLIILGQNDRIAKFAELLVK